MGISSSHLLNGGLGIFWHCIVYALFEFIGAGLAAGIFVVTHPSEYEEEKAGRDHLQRGH